MYFKLNPTESLAHLDNASFLKGISLLNCSNDFYTLLMKKKFKGKQELKILWGDQLTQSELENKISTIDLFSNQESYWIYNCEKIKGLDLQEFIELSHKISVDIILHFKNLRVKPKLKKIDYLNYVEVEDFKFWETGKIHLFLEKLLETRFSPDLKKYLETLSFDSMAEVFQFLDQLKNYNESLEDITQGDLVDFDQSLESKVFSFLNYYERKNLNGLYNEIDQIFQKNKVGEIFKILNFLKSSFYKVADEKYLENKPRLSSYDKTLKNIKKNSSTFEISGWIKQLSKLEVSLKRNTDEFNNYLTELRLS